MEDRLSDADSISYHLLSTFSRLRPPPYPLTQFFRPSTLGEISFSAELPAGKSYDAEARNRSAAPERKPRRLSLVRGLSMKAMLIARARSAT